MLLRCVVAGSHVRVVSQSVLSLLCCGGSNYRTLYVDAPQLINEGDFTSGMSLTMHAQLGNDRNLEAGHKHARV